MTLYDSADLRAQMGAKGWQRVDGRFSLEACKRHYLDLYRGLMRHEERPVAELIDPPQWGRTAELALPVAARERA